MGSLAVRISSIPGLPAYDQDKGIVLRTVELNDISIGEFSLEYDYTDKLVHIEQIYLGIDYRGKGIGSALFRAALSIPMPDGENPRDKGFILESKYGSDMANAVGESFVQRGIAERGTAGDYHYFMR